MVMATRNWQATKDQSSPLEPMISIMLYYGKHLWKTCCNMPLGFVVKVMILRCRTSTNSLNYSCHWKHFYLTIFLYCKSQAQWVAVCCHPNSSMTTSESFGHCSLTPKSPHPCPIRRPWIFAGSQTGGGFLMPIMSYMKISQKPECRY